MANDRTGIGLTADAAQTADTLVNQLQWFSEGQDAGRLAMAYAIEHEVGAGSSEGTETRWAIGQFDRTGEIRTLVEGIFPDCDTPVRQIEFLVNEGFRLIGEALNQGRLTPSDLLV